MSRRRLRATRIAAFFSGALALALLFASHADAAFRPAWRLTVTPNADYFRPGNEPGRLGYYKLEAENVGNRATAGEITLSDILPSGLQAEAVQLYAGPSGLNRGRSENNISAAHCPTLLLCHYGEALKSGEKLVMLVIVSDPTYEGPLEDGAEVSGGGALAAVAAVSNAAAAEPPFGKLGFAASLSDASLLNPYAQAGGRPYELVTEFEPATFSAPVVGDVGYELLASTATVRDPRDIAADLPPGLLANPQGVPACSLADWFAQSCERMKVAVGDACISQEMKSEQCVEITPIINLQPNGAYPGLLGIPVNGTPFVVITAGLRSGSDYGVTAVNVAPAAGVNHVHLNLWGVPADPAHNDLRGAECGYASGSAEFRSIAQLEEACAQNELTHGGPAGVPPTPFLVMPTECSGSPLTITGRYDTWQFPGEYAEASAQLQPVSGCNQLAGLFAPEITAQPTTNLADAPSGLRFDLHVPQHEGCTEPPSVSCEPATPSLKEAVVALPAGLSVNPSSGNGLAGCSPGQVGLRTAVGQTPAHFYETPAACPEQSAIGTAEVKTPLLHNPLRGVVYLASPNQNPYESLLAAYIVLEGEGLIVKLPGRIEADPKTGQLTGRFTEDPQTPFEDFHLTFFGGARGDLRTPAVCGTYETTSTLTPYSAPESGPPAEPRASFETTAPAHEGEACPSSGPGEPNSPAFHAGTESPEAGKFSPFSFRLARADGSQEISKIETTLPPGLVGKLAGVAECSEAQLAVAQSREHEGGGAEEQVSPACPSSSEVGTVEVGAGAGPTPLYVTGKAYLAGPYRGAPLSLAIITPAVAGPFDLGDVLVRSALYVDPETAQIKAVSDPIPHILQGIPLDVRSVALKMDRPDFTLNPTNCNEMAFSGAETSVLENVAPLAQRFQVGGCRALPFKPKLKLSLRGKTTRTGHPALKAVLTMKPGEANIARAQVTLPHSEFLDQSHIRTVCTRAQFSENACPAGSVYGHAKAWSPLLDRPLEGPVYLRSSSHELPDLVADLNGQIQIALDGRVDSVNARLRNTFEVVPDAPVSKFVLEMQGNRKGLLVNSTNICAAKAKNRAIALFTGQNGKAVESEPVVQTKCPKHKGGKRHGKKKRH